MGIRNKTPWMHQRSRHWHLTDYVITRDKDRQDVRTARAMCGATVGLTIDSSW